MRVFLSGDFEFLCHSHGIPGASGKIHGMHYMYSMNVHVLYMYTYLLYNV